MSTESRRQSAARSAFADRRKSPRVEVWDRLTARLMPQNLPVPLLNVSPGGFLTRMGAAWTVGDVHTFLFSADNESACVELRAQVVHTMRITTNGVSSYVIGLEFLDHDEPAHQAAIASLLQIAAS